MLHLQVLVDIGCNKGYYTAELFSLFAPQLSERLSPQKVSTAAAAGSVPCSGSQSVQVGCLHRGGAGCLQLSCKRAHEQSGTSSPSAS